MTGTCPNLLQVLELRRPRFGVPAWGTASLLLRGLFWFHSILIVLGAEPPGPLDLAGVGRMVDVEGHSLSNITNAAAAVVVFLSTDCPISNSYAPELARLQRRFSPSGIRFYAVYCEASESEATVQHHLKEYSLPITAVRDPHQQLASLLGITRTPEVAVLSSDGVQLYRGRIDNRHVQLGVARAEATERDLEAVLSAIQDGRRPPYRATTAVGCHLPPIP